MKTTALGASIVLSLAVISCAPATTTTAPAPRDVGRISVIPAPVSLTRGGGGPFVLDSSTRIVVVASSDSAMAVAEVLAAQLRPATGYPLAVSSESAPLAGAIVLRIDPSRTEVGAEGYRLIASPTNVVLEAQAAAGLYHGVQTIRQLLPFGIEAENSVIRVGDWQIPAVTITDYPRFSWRGAMLDVSRHFFTVDEVKQYIDILAMYKFNIFHIHLADDQGWRIEIKSRPQLVEKGSWMQVGGGPGGFYTQTEYAEIVKYAADRFITVVPEVDMPAHTNAMLISHPEVSCGRPPQPPMPYTSIHVGFSALCSDKEDTYRLIDDIIREITAITPGPYFHIGGDEVEMLTHEQYVRFVERAQEIVSKYGKRMVGWEEVTKAKLLPTSLGQQWKSDSAAQALLSGAKIIMSPAKKVYLDMKFGTTTELGLDWAGKNDISVSYDWDPATYTPGVTESQIVGVEAPLWGETVRNITAAQYLAMPRLPSVAEVGWTPQASRRWDDFRLRLAAHAPRWRLMGINYYASPQIPWQ